MASESEDRPASKVARLIAEYDLTGLGAELEERWTAKGAERMSLRDLADHFNRELLRERLIEAGLDALETDVETTYQTLQGDDVSAGVRTDTETRLAEGGIDVEALQRDFVTYQAIRSYLTEYRGAEYEGISDTEKVAKDRQSIQRLLTRADSVTTGRIEQLRDSGRFAMGDFEVLLTPQVLCQECGAQHSLAELFEQRGCDCQREATDADS